MAFSKPPCLFSPPPSKSAPKTLSSLVSIKCVQIRIDLFSLYFQLLESYENKQTQEKKQFSATNQHLLMKILLNVVSVSPFPSLPPNPRPSLLQSYFILVVVQCVLQSKGTYKPTESTFRFFSSSFYYYDYDYYYHYYYVVIVILGK